MAIPLGVQIAATGLSMYSSLQQGKALKREAAFNREQYKQQARQQEIAGLERANIRMQQYRTAESANQSFLAFLNRDTSDRSMKAFMDRQKEIAFSDIASIESGALQEASQSRTLAQMESFKGKNAVRTSYLNAASSLASGIYRYHIYKT
jgi:hypothetical protein